MIKPENEFALLKPDDNLSFIDWSVEDLYIYIFPFGFHNLMLNLKYSVIWGWMIFSKRVYNLVIEEIRGAFPTWH